MVQERLGHHSHHLTSDTYQHALEGMDEHAAGAFDAHVFAEPANDVVDDGTR